MFCMHKWEKWSAPISTFSGHKQQWRVCQKCNKAQFRTLGWDKQSSVVDVNRALELSKGTA